MVVLTAASHWCVIRAWSHRPFKVADLPVSGSSKLCISSIPIYSYSFSYGVFTIFRGTIETWGYESWKISEVLASFIRGPSPPHWTTLTSTHPHVELLWAPYPYLTQNSLFKYVIMLRFYWEIQWLLPFPHKAHVKILKQASFPPLYKFSFFSDSWLSFHLHWPMVVWSCWFSLAFCKSSVHDLLQANFFFESEIFITT